MVLAGRQANMGSQVAVKATETFVNNSERETGSLNTHECQTHLRMRSRPCEPALDCERASLRLWNAPHTAHACVNTSLSATHESMITGCTLPEKHYRITVQRRRVAAEALGSSGHAMKATASRSHLSSAFGRS